MAIYPPSLGGGGGQGGSGSPDTPTQIKNKLETLTGSGRLEATAIQNLPTPSAGMLTKLLEVATSESLAHGGTFSWSGANDFIANIGIPAEFRNIGSYAAPNYFNINNELGFFGGTGDDPTDDTQGFIVVRLPSEYFNNSSELRMNVAPSSSGGSRGTWVYNGDATASGVLLIPTRGDYENTNGLITKFFDIPASSNDIYIYISRTSVFDIAVVNKTARYDTVLASSNLAQSAVHLRDYENLVDGSQLGISDANRMLTGLGVGAAWRTDGGRDLPHLRIDTAGGRGVRADGALTDDPTSTDAALAFSEFIIENSKLRPDQKIELTYYGNGGVRLYAGNPTASGTEIPAIFTGSGTGVRSSTYYVSRNPTSDGWIPNAEDLHVCVMGCSLTNVQIFDTDRTKAEEEHLLELRGGVRPAEFSSTQDYSIGDFVYRTVANRTYQAFRSVAAGPWNPSDWQEESVMNHGNEISGLIAQNANQEREINALRGEGAYNTFSDTASYAEGDRVHFGQRNYEANQVVSPGSWDSSQWDEMSVEQSSTPSVIRDRLQRLTDDDRLDASAIKNIPRASGAEYQITLREIATRDGLSDGDQMSWIQTDELFSDVLGIDCTARRTNQRIRPFYHDLGGNEYVTINGANASGNPSADGSFIEFSFSKAGYFDRNLILQFRNSGSTGDRRCWVFDGDPTSGGTEIEPLSGNVTNTHTDPRYVAYSLPNTGANNIHVVLNRVALTDMFFTTLYDEQRKKLSRASFSESVHLYALYYGTVHGEQLSFPQAEDILSGINYGARVQNLYSRIAPKSWQQGYARGWYADGTDAQDETTNAAEVVEIIIPSYNLTHDTLIDIRHREVYTTGVDRHVVVYAGNPTDGNPKLAPISGSEESSASESRTVWRVSTTPESGALVPYDIHIVMRRSAINALDLIKQADIAVPDYGLTQRIEMRGQNRPAEYSDSVGYSEGDRVYRSATNRTYVAQSTFGAGSWDASRWREMSILENEGRIRALEGGSGSVGGSYTFENLIDVIASKHNIANGGTFTNGAAEELFSTAFGTPVTVRTTNGRVNGTYSQGSPSSIWCSGGNPPTGNGPFIEVIIPANVISNMDLILSGNRASSTGTRGFWLYEGNPTAGGTYIPPVQGSRINTTNEIRTTVYDLGAVNGEMHLVISRTLLSDLQLIPSSIRKNEVVGSSRFSEAFYQMSTMYGIGHNATLTVDQVNNGLVGEGIGMRIREGDGRVLPRMFNAGNRHGIFGGEDDQDETTTTGQVVELIIPSRSVEHNSVLELGYSQVSSGGNDRDIVVYSGNPTGGGTRLTPTQGTEAHSTAGRTVWNLSDTPDALTNFANDIHIVIKRSCLTSFDLHTRHSATASQQTGTTYRFTQASHGLTVRQAVRVTSGSWVTADSGAVSTTASGIVSEVVDASNFVVQFDGLMTQTGHGLTVGEYYWLGSSGAVTATQPTTGVVQQMLYVIDANTLLIDRGQPHILP